MFLKINDGFFLILDNSEDVMLLFHNILSYPKTFIIIYRVICLNTYWHEFHEISYSATTLEIQLKHEFVLASGASIPCFFHRYNQFYGMKFSKDYYGKYFFRKICWLILALIIQQKALLFHVCPGGNNKIISDSIM